MFSVSATEFSELTEFVNKLKTNTHEKADFDTIRNWCSEKGFLLHFSKIHAAAASSSSSSSSSPDIFYTLKYDRAKLTPEQFSTLGRFRSVVFDRDGNICCVAPPKMLTLTEEMNVKEVNSVNSSLSAEELVEGIMVNLFWKNDKWYIATKSCVGELSFDHIIQEEAAAVVAAAVEAVAESDVAGESKAFQKLGVQEILRRRICEVFSLLPGGLENVSKQYCYSFVVQHPKNQIVNHITVPKLYLVAVYQLSKVSDSDSDSGSGVNVIRVHRDVFSSNFGGSVSHMPSTLTCVLDDVETDAVESVSFTPHTVADYCKMYASADTRSVSLPGVVFVDKDTGFCYKKRNPKYESVKKRKGMEQKLAAQYLQLRKDHGIDEYLKYHPQHSRAFHQFRERLHEYTQKLYDAYIEHYVKKNAKPLKEYDRELKIHMYKLHYDFYLAKMKETGVFVTKHTVIDYVNQLAAAQQLVCLNATPHTEVSQERSAPRHQIQNQNQKRHIERAKPHQEGGNVDSGGSGFRNTRHSSRGGGRRMTPSLSVQIPNADDTSDTAAPRMKGSNTTGTIKVQNQFAGLEVD